MREIPKTLFLSWGMGVVGYYRCFLPALALGADYVAGVSLPPEMRMLGGMGKSPTTMADLEHYDVIVMQQPRGREFLKLINQLQDKGVVVLYEIDDYIQSARKMKTHELNEMFDADFVRELELSMPVCDGMIVSTPYLARRYRAFNPRTWACPNGIDLKRYAWPRPPRPDGVVTIGWAGGVGHQASLERWDPAIRAVMRARPNTRFVSLGFRYSQFLWEEFGQERAWALPPAPLETYAATMTLFDIAIAPSAETNLFKGKSDLRWLEASALKLPLVAHPEVYPEIEDGVTGVHARTLEEVEASLLRLIDDAAERERIGNQAYEYVAAHRGIEVMAENWRAVLNEVAPVASA